MDPSMPAQVDYGQDAAFVGLNGGEKIELVRVPAGAFWMGSRPADPEADPQDAQRRVVIATPFYLGKYPVTQSQWAAEMGANPAFHPGGGDLPVESVSWEDCAAFCRQVSKRTGRTIRLPSEAEWEYACRAGSTTLYSFGDALEQLAEYGWYRGNSGGQSHTVGAKRPNAWNLYDMHGGIDEFCQDTWHPTYQGAPADGSAWIAGGEETLRVLRGGSWYDQGEYCSSPHRNYYEFNLPSEDHGVRILMENAVPRVERST